MNTTMAVRRARQNVRSNGRVNGHAILQRINNVIGQVEPTWQESLNNTKMGTMTRLFLEQQLMPYILKATDEWTKAVEALDSGIDKPKTPMKERLKKFFALNPFGCRNKKMIQCISIILECPIGEITPEMTKATESRDGDADEPEIGFLSVAPPGTAVKVIGGTPGVRNAQLNRGIGDIFFVGTDINEYGRVMRENGTITDFSLDSLASKITPMPEHYRAATPGEIVEVLLHGGFDYLQELASHIMSKEMKNELFSEGRKKSSAINNDEDSDSDNE